MTIVEKDSKGGLYVPAELVSQFEPRAFEVEAVGDELVLRPVDEGRAFWERSTPEERVRAFLEWAEADRPPAPDLSDEMLSREYIYD